MVCEICTLEPPEDGILANFVLQMYTIGITREGLKSADNMIDEVKHCLQTRLLFSMGPLSMVVEDLFCEQATCAYEGVEQLLVLYITSLMSFLGVRYVSVMLIESNISGAQYI